MSDEPKKPRKRDSWCEWKCSWCEVAHEAPCTFFADNQPFCSLDCIAELGAQYLSRDQGEPAYDTDMVGPESFPTIDELVKQR